MKIDKLYTLSQFILLIKEKVINEGLDFAMALSLIFRYLEFLLQPLTKEMFVNEIEKPSEESYIDYNHDNKFFDHEEYEIDLKAWEEAEKKVIFYFEHSDNNYFHYGRKSIYFEKSDRIAFYKGHSKYGLMWLINETLSDLAEKTNGELKLKNVEI